MGWLWLLPALLLVLSCVPLGVAFEVTSVPRWRSSMRLDWGGLLESHVELGPHAARKGAERPPERRRTRPKRRRRRPRPAALLHALGHGVGLMRRLLAQTRVKSLRLNARFGLDDPADTGTLYGALVPFFVALQGRWRRSCVFEPEFTRECLEVSASARLTLVPLRWLLVMGRFLVSPRTWRVAFELGRR